MIINVKIPKGQLHSNELTINGKVVGEVLKLVDIPNSNDCTAEINITDIVTYQLIQSGKISFNYNSAPINKPISDRPGFRKSIWQEHIPTTFRVTSCKAPFDLQGYAVASKTAYVPEPVKFKSN